MSVDFSLSVPDDLGTNEMDALLASVADSFDVAQQTSKQFGPEVTMILGMLKDTATVVGGLGSLAKLTEMVISWRRSRAIVPNSKPIVLKIAETDQLDLRVASEAEIAAVLARLRSGAKD